MKNLLALTSLLFLTACNTVSGTLIGVGKDLQAAGEYANPKEQVPLDDKKSAPINEKVKLKSEISQ